MKYKTFVSLIWIYYLNNCMSHSGGFMQNDYAPANNAIRSEAIKRNTILGKYRFNGNSFLVSCRILIDRTDGCQNMSTVKQDRVEIFNFNFNFYSLPPSNDFWTVFQLLIYFPNSIICGMVLFRDVNGIL